MNQIKVQDTAMYQTRDFGQFKILNYNRELDFKRVEALMVSIRENGFLMPILVSQNMAVADGQHRLEAAKRLNVEVTYIKYNISDNYLPLLISELNSLSKNWKMVDYYKMWQRIGKENYLWIGEMIKKHNFTFDEIYMIIFIKGNQNINKKFKRGEVEFTATQKEKAEDKCNKINNVLNYSPLFKNFNLVFRRAIIETVCTSGYDENIMMKKLQSDAGRLLNCINRMDFLLQIEAIYNRGEKYPIDFIKTGTNKTSRKSIQKAKLKKVS